MVVSYFDRSKKSVLDKLFKPDKSRKGDVDVDAVPVIDVLNSLDDFYTTSSCGGRISLFYESLSRKKKDSGWLFVKHGLVSFDEIKKVFINVKDETVWFRQEAPIFHVACRDLDSANLLLEISRNLGFKRSGIIGVSRRFMVEIVFNDKMDVPLARNGKVFLFDDYLEFLVETANQKFLFNKNLIFRFVEKLNELQKLQKLQKLKNNKKIKK